MSVAALRLRKVYCSVLKLPRVARKSRTLACLLIVGTVGAGKCLCDNCIGLFTFLLLMSKNYTEIWLWPFDSLGFHSLNHNLNS